MNNLQTEGGALIFKDGMPCVEDSNNQIDSNGLPAERYNTKQTEEDMNKML